MGRIDGRGIVWGKAKVTAAWGKQEELLYYPPPPSLAVSSKNVVSRSPGWEKNTAAYA